ncbi:ankyrin repeat and LEM domain-containing protein 2 [Rhinichthys klamathensis goyatoka]|uniref:ankyrin repeat and LEM domain-containing protein 2 n=1 Tax=Rhinichthys klamathensis goyatoka TaxID=3034132 RepID=UPI0024B4D3A9|nr:ankyrin repeat and LEM domain-containing protein 2 [Rhinichthys klamathensis goyatoka]
MEAVLKRLQTLTSDQLRDQIISAGLRCGPVTATTRSIFEKKLARALLEGSDVAVVHSGSPDPVEEPISETENGEERNHDAQTSTESPSVYYGVCPQPGDPSVEDGSPLVYAEKTKALKAVMKLRGARFKAFARREDAENFAKGVCDGGASPHTPSPEKPGAGSVTEWLMNADPANMEKANEFRSPRTQDLTAKLRRAVERGDEDTFRELVWGNPRYLIGSGDNPTIVQEGCRYNVLHVAAKENQAGIARLVLETLEDPEFMRLMYPHDQELMLWQRIRYIVDLYLNTPDKASNETPLHFACKFGCPEVVDVLCSHPCVDKHCRNKYDQNPSSMICERKNRSKEVKQKIREYLEDRFYVPLLRAADNTLPPEISAPWCPGSPESCDRFYRPDRMTDSPKHPTKIIKAFVGPLNASKAEEFHRLWKTPPRDRAGYFHHILKSDSQRGAERVGRELAREMGHPWAEDWDFLQCFIDLSSREGLQMLDEHLRSTEARLGRTSRLTLNPADDEEPEGSRRFPVCDLMQEFEKVLLSADHMIRCDEADDGSSISSEEYFTADEDDDDRPSSSASDSGSSFKSTRSSADRDTGSVDRHRSDVYILGDSPCKLDCEVLLALSGVDIDPLSLPSVARWRDRVMTYSASETQSWPSASPSRSPSAFTLKRVTVSPKPRSAGHFHPGQFMFSPPSRAYTRL